MAKSKMADSRVVTTTTHSFHPKALSFFFFSLSLSRQDRCWYRRGLLFLVVYYSFEREDRPPIDYYSFLFCFFLYIFRLDLSSFFFVSSLSGDFKPSSPFCERAHHFLKVTFSLSLFCAQPAPLRGRRRRRASNFLPSSRVAL